MSRSAISAATRGSRLVAAATAFLAASKAPSATSWTTHVAAAAMRQPGEQAQWVQREPQ